MRHLKYAAAAVVLVAIYFVFFASGLPREIDFQGQTLGSREKVENNSLLNFGIYAYRDQTNHHVLLFLLVEDESATAQQLLEFYIRRFEGQGFRFEEQDNRYFGTKNDEVIFMTKAPRMDAAIAYMEKSPSPFPTGIRSASDIYADLEGFSF